LQNANYAGLKYLIDTYGSRGFAVLGFPSNQFGAQAPRCSACERAYAYYKVGIEAAEAVTTFPVFDKVDANGPAQSPVYALLKRQKKLDGCAGCEIAWNYEKFIVDGTGSAVARLSPEADPREAEDTIRALLAD